jgi:YidC/Oxa1 family membrane protein insertase
MDIQRSLLIAGLILISVLLLTEWVEFRAEHDAAGAATATATTQSSADNSAIPASSSAPNEIPQATATAPAAGDQPTTKPTPSHADGDPTVAVITDTLQLEIALRGGDITGVALPQHRATLGKSSSPFQLLENSAAHVYIAQSGLVGPNGTDTDAGRPLYQSAARRYELTADKQELVVELQLQSPPPGISIAKRYILRRGEYLVRVEYAISNNSTAPWQAALYGQLKRDNAPTPGAQGGMLGIQPFLGFATHTADAPYKKFTFEDVAETPYAAKNKAGWIALVQHYFISAWIPDAAQEHSYEMLQSGGVTNIGRFLAPVTVVAPGAATVIAADFYAGPKDQYRLRQISSGLELTVDYGWLWWIAQPLFALLHFFATGEAHMGGWSFSFGSGIGNWGWSIILLTVLVKLAFFHLSATSYKSMAKMRKLQPKMLELRERLGDDRQKLSQETMELYRKEKVNPLGGCLPILIQMPVFLSLYWVLLESVELRHAPWLAWIKDLSVMDPFFVLPLLMGGSMYFQQKLNPPPPDPMQAKIFQFMPIIFTVFFLFFPAGLVLYWLVNNLLSIAQQWVITRKIEQAP